jgi:transposase
MKQKSGPGKAPAEQVVKDIRRQTRRHYSAEEKIRIVLEGSRGEENISELCRSSALPPTANGAYCWLRYRARSAVDVGGGALGDGRNNELRLALLGL